MAVEPISDPEFTQTVAGTSLKLTDCPVIRTDLFIKCDLSQGYPRPFVPKSW